VYVAGPLKPDEEHPYRVRSSWTQRVIRRIRAEAEHVGVRLLLPESDAIDPAHPNAFYREIDRRIAGADAVISILADGDRESAVEAMLASTHGKPQMIVAKSPHQVPRILRGMPGVVEVGVSHELPPTGLAGFLLRVRNKDWSR
jgi:hypothetical protein